MASTLVEIIGKDSTGAAFNSATGRIQGLANSASRLNGILGAIGATAVVGALGSFVKSTIDAQDNLFKLSQKTGIAVESLAGLGFAAEQSGVELETVAKGVRKFSLLVAGAADASSGAAKKLNQLGLSYQQLKDLSPEKQLLALSDALSKYSKEDRAVALTATLGNKMADLIPLLSQGSNELSKMIEQGKKLNPVTERSAALAERYNDQMNVLGKSVSALGQSMVVELIPGLTRTSDAMVKAGESGGFLSGALAGVKQLFTEAFGNPKILGDVGQIRREIFKTQDVIRQMSAKKGSVFFDANALEFEKVKLQQLEGDLQTALTASRVNAAATRDNTAETKKFAIALDAVKTDKATAGLNRLSEAQKKAKEEQQQLNRQMSEGNSLSESVDPILKRNNALAKYIDLLKVGALTQENFDKLATNAINDAAKATENNTEALATLNTETRNTTDQVSQLWMQAGRNIQSTLANSIFNFFDDGLKGMVKNVGIAVGRILSEFAALKLAQGIGLDRMFGVEGNSASSSGSGLFNIASGGMNLAGMARGGFGTTGMIGTGISTLGRFAGSGSMAAFGAGFGGDAIAGVAAGVEAGMTGSMAASAASMGASFAAAAGPAIALFAVDQIGRLLAGDKTLKGFDKIPVLGGFIAALFGHGPMKFRQQSLQGTATSGGFVGDITNVFRAKGGLVVGNKHKSVTEQFSLEMQTMLDSTLKGFSGSVHGFAENLGLSTEAVDNFSREIQIKSEKGKQITEEAVSEMLDGIGNEFAQGVLPIVDTLRKAGEDSFDTLSRLNSEFVTLSGAARVLGLSLEDSKTAIRSAGFELRTSFVDAAGGVESFGSKIGFIADNFLTAEQRLSIETEDLNAVLTKLGIPLGTTKDQFYELLQAAAQAGDAIKFGGLLDVAQIYLNVSSAAEQVMLAEQAHAQSITAAADKFLTAEQLYTRSSRNLNDELKSLGVSTDITKEGYLKLIQAGGDLGESLALLADHFLSVRNSSQYMTESLANSPRAGRVAELNAQRRKEQNDPYKWYAEFQENVVADMRASESLRTTTLLNRDPAEFLRQFNAAPSNAPRILDQATTDRVDALAAAIKNLGIAANDANFNLLAPAYNLNLVIERTGINFETLAGRLDYFANNFLDGSEKTKLASDAISQSLKSVGIASIENADKLKTLIMSFGSAGGVNAEQFSTLLEIAPLLKDQFDAQKNVNSVIDNNIVALRSAADIAQEKYGLESQLLQIQGNTTELRRRELDALDPSNRALQERIWALDDEKTAIDKLIAGVDTAFSALQRAVDGEKATLTAAFNSALAESEKRISSVSESVSKLTSLSELLKSTTGSINPLSLSEARGRVQLAVDSGDLDNEDLRGAIETLGKQQLESDFSSRVDFMRGQAKNVGLLDELNSVTKAELTLEERTLSALEAAKRRIEDGFRADIERLDQIVTSAQTQIDVLRGIDISILTIPSAIAGLGASIQSANAAMAASASAAAAAASASAAALQQVAVKPFGLDDQPAVGMFRLVSGNEIPKFASGTSFVPRTGPAIVHQGERIINPEQNQDLIRLLGQLVQKIADGNADTAELLRVLKSMRVETDDGVAIRNQVAA